MKEVHEQKKINDLQSSLHFIHGKPITKNEKKSTHTIFLDDEEQALNFDAAKHFNTLPEFLDNHYNRPTIENLMSKNVVGDLSSMKKLEKKRNQSYQELRQRIIRKKKIEKVRQRMELKKALFTKGRRKKIKSGDRFHLPVFKWEIVRQK
ncbi:u3 small nucleolar RNA-associated protein [Anaeramoeba ignava]|uniref:U3 small nucleolar RNA-associated protein n=1 Tax=Anaeramoeba ignava TaxID=1746090 RepID=A0A9Q0R841_ANAIG|nr:u3 small nucleolar RNA-associated protein [Anaeramoeba ignava]